MKKFLSLILAVGAAIIIPTLTQAQTQEQLTVTSFYPSPAGNFNQIRLVPSTYVEVNPCDIGTMYVNSSGTLRYCHSNSGVGQWGSRIEGIWEKSGSNIYAIDTSANVGVGTTSVTSGLKLDVRGKIGGTLDGSSNIGELKVKWVSTAPAGYYAVYAP